MYLALFCFIANMEPMTDESALFDLLYDQHASAESEEGRRPYLLVECLVTIQNSMIPEDDR